MVAFIINKLYCYVLLFVLSLVVSCDSSTGTSDITEITSLGDGYNIYNLIPDFLFYAEKGSCYTCNNRVKFWNTLLESKYPDFFNQVIYRNKQGEDRESYKSTLIDSFWNDVVPNKLTDLRKLNQSIVQKILDSRKKFKEKFISFNPQCDHYVTVSFSFNGKAVELNGKTVFAIGLENFRQGEPYLDFTIFHELYHLHHFSAGFSTSGALYRGIWAEGMASYAQVFFCPGSYTYSQYLNFTGERIDEIVNNFDNLRNDVIKNIYNNDETVKRAYLGMEDNSLGVPPGAGYYFGLRIVLALLGKGYTFEEMTLWNAEKAAQMMNLVLPGLTAS